MDEIHEPLREDDVDAHLGIPRGEADQDGRQQPVAEIRGRGEPHRSARSVLKLGDRRRRLVDAGERAGDGLVVRPSRLGRL